MAVCGGSGRTGFWPGLLQPFLSVWRPIYLTRIPLSMERGGFSTFGILRHAPALPLLRRISAPFDKVSDLPAKYTAGTTDFGNEVELSRRAILEIEHRPNPRTLC